MTRKILNISRNVTVSFYAGNWKYWNNSMRHQRPLFLLVSSQLRLYLRSCTVTEPPYRWQ